ncbi:MAG TPA: rod shape-determining protein RodA [Streptosporangiaceae bacterium]|nr:rod shape-determining protein RodA [Streptosporangiaceae bacterium]
MSWVSGHPRSRPAPALVALRWVGTRLAGRDSALRQADWLLMVCVLAMTMLGTLVIWAATAPMLLQQGSNPHSFLLKQLLNIALGLILMLVVSSLDARQLRLWAPVLYVLSCLGLVAVLTPLGSIVNGARSWISIGAGFQIEPSEFAKLSVIVITAMLLSDVRHGQTRPAAKAIGIAVAVAAVPILLVVAEPDLGVTIVLVLILVGMIALSGVRLRWLAGMAALTALTIAAIAKLHLLKAYQLGRLTSFINPSADPRGTGYSAAQAQIAIGSGGIHGTGLFRSQMIAGSFVPEQHTDFIFAVVGNELGFVGACLVIGLLGLLLFCALRISIKAEDQFGTLVAAGIAIWFAVQAFVNIGMTMGIMPVTGLPLPFVSYGGSAMFADMMAVGLLQSVRRRRCVFTS